MQRSNFLFQWDKKLDISRLQSLDIANKFCDLGLTKLQKIGDLVYVPLEQGQGVRTFFLIFADFLMYTLCPSGTKKSKQALTKNNVHYFALHFLIASVYPNW